jgi:hypothetical protein
MSIDLIILPLDGGGLRWGWTRCAPPHPLPLPPEEREMTDYIAFNPNDQNLNDRNVLNIKKFEF